MSQLKKNHFKLTFIAVAVLSLSACSTAPKVAGVDLGELSSTVGSGLSKLGTKTADISADAWDGTKNIWEDTKDLLNIGSDDQEPMDEVDLALMEDDVLVEGVPVARLEGEALLPEDDTQQPLAFGEIPQAPEMNNDSLGGDIVVLASANDNQTDTFAEEIMTEGAGEQLVPLLDLTHVVEKSETLWDIAKSTTGDANNWHILADINNLPPNASVYVGQKLLIPADMVKAEYGSEYQPVLSEPTEGTELMANAEQAKPLLKAEPTAAVALNIPQANDEIKLAEENVVAAVEPAAPAAALPEAPATPVLAADIMTDAMPLKVGAGETLWDFAKRTTGDATNWKAIAEKNMFDEQQLARIRPGQKIYVPANIVRARDENGVLIPRGEEANVAAANIGGVAPKNTAANKAAIDASTAVIASAEKPAAALPAEGEIKIVEAAYQDNNGIKPVTAESLSDEAAVQVAANDGEPGKVMVKGTYYPKAVYHTADFSSTLLMRVSPGTELLVSKAVGPWLEVQTDKGVGYVHSRDIK